MRYTAGTVEKVLSQRKKLSAAVRALQAYKVKLVAACKSLQKKAEEATVGIAI